MKNATLRVSSLSRKKLEACAQQVGVPVRAESGGASSSALALSIAMRVSFRGSLHKLSRDGGLFGLRWQKRNFLLDGCALSYSHAENHHSRQGKGNYQVWGVYGLRVSARDSVVQRKEVTGREHVFGLYTGGEQENGAKREQLVLLSADTHEDVDNWLRMIYLAAGRPGVLLRASQDGVLQFMSSLSLSLSLRILRWSHPRIQRLFPKCRSATTPTRPRIKCCASWTRTAPVAN